MNKTYIPALFTAILLATLHKFASDGHWYVRYPGFDILMHILGGVALALAAYWMLVTFIPKYFKPGQPVFWKLIVITFILGLGWEVMETMNNIAGAPVGTGKYYFDSFKDLVNDTLGAIIAAYFIERK